MGYYVEKINTMKLRPFEIVLIAAFVGLGLFALVFLSAFQNSQKDIGPTIGVVTIWGTLDARPIEALLDELATADDAYVDVSYRQVDENQFASELTNALADGRGPDVILVSHEKLIELRRRISPISYESFPIRDVRSLYVDGAEIFALSDGLYAYPIAVDPLMLYWNRDLLTSSNFLEAPKTWESLVTNYVPNLTVRDFDRSIERSAVAMGEYQNVSNAFGIISALLIQSGSRLVEETNGTYEIYLNETRQGGNPLVTTTDFYTRFSRPNNTLYSWNRSQALDKEQFLSEDLAMYFGFASEGPGIERLNPNLNFDIAEVPQGASATIRRTYGKFYGLSLVRNTVNPSGAAAVMSVLASADNAKRIAVGTGLVPASRSAVSAGSNDTYGRLAYRSAPIAYGWLNPARSRVDSVLTTLMRDVTEGRFTEEQATTDAIGRLELEYN